MKNRTIIGIICIVLALALAFVIAPLVGKYSDERAEIVRIKRDISQGHKLTAEDFEVVSVGSYNLPSGTITATDAVLDKFAACDLKKGDFVFPSKLTETADNAADVFRTLDGSQVAMSITIPSFAGGLSGKLENGDIVSLLFYSDKNGNSGAVIPESLKYVRVITATTADGLDKDELVKNEDGTYDLPTTLTLLVEPIQARLLSEYENSGKIHAVLVSRGDDERAEKLLAEQKTALKQLETR